LRPTARTTHIGTVRLKVAESKSSSLVVAKAYRNFSIDLHCDATTKRRLSSLGFWTLSITYVPLQENPTMRHSPIN
jgi:hypothetical protein